MAELIVESDDGIAELRARCGQCRDLLAELADIHFEVDPPSRLMETDEPDWIGRMRKILLHIMAINRWEIGACVEHVMAPEIRAAYEQLHFVWKCLPATMRLDDMDVGWWAHEARSSLLATYDHPTPQTLMLSAEHGGFSTGERGMVYGLLTVWLGYLGIGYGLALVHLSQVLASGEDIESRVTSIFNGMPPWPTPNLGMTDKYETSIPA